MRAVPIRKKRGLSLIRTTYKIKRGLSPILHIILHLFEKRGTVTIAGFWSLLRGYPEPCNRNRPRQLDLCHYILKKGFISLKVMKTFTPFAPLEFWAGLFIKL